jgi:hypothetical protein
MILKLNKEATILGDESEDLRDACYSQKGDHPLVQAGIDSQFVACKSKAWFRLG